MSKEISVSDEAKHHLAVELGNHSRFLYEYGYSQIVDILAKGGFLRSPEPVSIELKKCATKGFSCDPSYDEETGFADTWAEAPQRVKEYWERITRTILDAAGVKYVD